MVLLVAVGSYAGGAFDGWAVLSNVLLVQNITGHESRPLPLWSLPYEVQTAPYAGPRGVRDEQYRAASQDRAAIEWAARAVARKPS